LGVESWLKRAAHWIVYDWRLLAPLLAANVAGMVFGWYYYFDAGQFDPGSRYFEHPGWWILVADSPNALVPFVIALVGRRLGWRSRWMDSFAFLLNVYVGLWTTVLFLAYADQMGTFEAGSTNSILFLTHLGMPLQALLLVPELRHDGLRPALAISTAAFAVLYVWVDYAGPHLHPAPFLAPDDRLLHLASPWLMAAAFLALAVVAWSRPSQRVEVAHQGGGSP
jgi:uncharacterized membrane protein YpjA